MLHICSDRELRQRYDNKRRQLLAVFALGVAAGVLIANARMPEAIAQGPVFDRVPEQGNAAACVRQPAHRRADCVRAATDDVAALTD